MKRNVYIDCDGVIFDSETLAFKEMGMMGITDNDEITEYFKNADWLTLFESGGVINDAVNKIRDLYNSNNFEEIAILTHVCSFREAVFKTETFENLLPEITTITIPKIISKHEVEGIIVQNNFLIDDSKVKIANWIAAGGIGILFDKSAPKLIRPFELSKNQDYFIINDLNMINYLNNFYRFETEEKSFSKN